MGTVISLDVGTSKLCALAYDSGADRILALRGAPNATELPERAAGRHEQDPYRIRDLCWDLIRDLLADPAVRRSEVTAIALTGQMHGLLLADPALEPLTGLITWQDRRTEAWDQPGNILQAQQAAGDAARARTGCGLHEGYGGATLFWLAANRRLPASAAALSVCDFLAASLCGVFATDHTHAASWGLLDIARREWDAETVRALRIPEAALPAVRPAARPLGEILSAKAHALGLPPRVVVCSPLGDNQASVIGAAGMGSDAIVVNVGTGGQVSVPSDSPEVITALETRPMPFEGYIRVGATLCGGAAYAHLHALYAGLLDSLGQAAVDSDEVYGRMNALAAQAPPGCEGLRVDTRFDGARDAPEIRGSIQGVSTRNLTPSNLTRAVLEGVVRELAEMANAADQNGFDHVVASGNAVRRVPVLREIIARQFGAECTVPPEREEAALGAARAVSHGMAIG